jgi:hypothetical protein
LKFTEFPDHVSKDYGQSLAKFLPLVRARIVSGHLTESGQFFEKCKSYNFSPQVCGTGRKFAEYDQRVN